MPFQIAVHHREKSGQELRWELNQKQQRKAATGLVCGLLLVGYVYTGQGHLLEEWFLSQLAGPSHFNQQSQ